MDSHDHQVDDKGHAAHLPLSAFADVEAGVSTGLLHDVTTRSDNNNEKSFHKEAIHLVVNGQHHQQQERPHHRELTAFFGLTGSTPLEVCESTLTSWYRATVVERFQTNCECRGSVEDGFVIDCRDECQRCADHPTNQDDINNICALYGVLFETEPGDENLGVMTFRQCYSFTTGHDICFDRRFASIEGSASVEYTVNGEECNSVQDFVCGAVGDFITVADLVDCSNLGYGDAMNFCNGAGIVDQPDRESNPFYHKYNAVHQSTSAPEMLSVGECVGSDGRLEWLNSPSGSLSLARDGVLTQSFAAFSLLSVIMIWTVFT